MNITEALMELVAGFPGFEDVVFGALEAEGGVSFIPEEGKATKNVRRDITGRTRRTGLYPFTIAVGAGALSPFRRAALKERLEELGTYLETVKPLPQIAGGRLISVERVKAAYMDGQARDRTERWVLRLTAKYETQF